MESYLEERFGGVQAKNSSEEALRRWRRLCSVVKNPKRRFRFTANLEKRGEAEAIKHANHVRPFPLPIPTPPSSFLRCRRRDPPQASSWDLDLGPLPACRRLGLVATAGCIWVPDSVSSAAAVAMIHGQASVLAACFVCAFWGPSFFVSRPTQDLWDQSIKPLMQPKKKTMMIVLLATIMYEGPTILLLAVILLS
jgi:hypothetical protein